MRNPSNWVSGGLTPQALTEEPCGLARISTIDQDRGRKDEKLHAPEKSEHGLAQRYRASVASVNDE